MLEQILLLEKCYHYQESDLHLHISEKMPFELSDTIRGLFKVRFLHSQQVENGLIKYVSGNNTCQYFSHFMVFTTSKASYELHLPQHTYTNEHWQKNNEIYIRSNYKSRKFHTSNNFLHNSVIKSNQVLAAKCTYDFDVPECDQI